MPSARAREFLVANFTEAIVSTIHHQADTENAGDHHNGHDLIAEERENAFLNEEPVVAAIIDRITKPGPGKNTQDAYKFLPYLADIQLHFPVCQIQNTPAEQQAVVHEGLENQIAERGLTAQSSTGIAHPHYA